MNKYNIEFFSIIEELHRKNPNIQVISKILTKLNNPTYYEKFHSINPYVKLGFPYSKVTNPILLAISAMLKLIAENKENLVKKLQIEISWAFHRYSYYI